MLKKIIKQFIPKGIRKKLYTLRSFMIYAPYYNPSAASSNFVPEIYNKNGKPMDIFFINDVHFAHAPYGLSQNFLWDRFNFGLDTHFYTHEAMLKTVGKPKRKYGWLFESEAIVPRDYEIFDRHKGLEKEFDLIFTHSENILNKCDNARFAPGSGVWYGTPFDGGTMLSETYKLKKKNISIIASGKSACELHLRRADLARRLKNTGKADTFGAFDGGERIKYVADTLTGYRYSIAFENFISPFYFTEKILNCFASMAVPIYVGATQIGKFFNEDGIIRLSVGDLDNAERILKQCSEHDYEQRLPAIKDNYERVQKFLTVEDYIFENYLMTNVVHYAS